MRYRIRPALWERLVVMERSMSWLARQIGYTSQHVRRLHVRPEMAVRERFAVRAAEVLGASIDDLFERIDGGTKGGATNGGEQAA